MQEQLKVVPEYAQPIKGRVFGNAEVVQMFERWLEAAKKGSIGYAVIAAVIPPKDAVWDWTGSVDYEGVVPFVLDELKKAVEKGLQTRDLPPPNPKLDASYVVYNCCKQALSYDFIPWLVGAKMEMVREDAAGPLKVGFWAGESGTLGLDHKYRIQMFNNVVKPSLPLLGAIEDSDALQGRGRGFRLKEIVEGARRGEAVPKFKPSPKAKATVESWLAPGEKMATITLREMDSWTHRNSNIEAWKKFSEYLKADGWLVVFVRDTAKAEEELPGYCTCPAASVSIDARCALYQRADANFFVSNGPVSLVQFMDAPWLMLSQFNEESDYYPERSCWWESHGMKAGEQFPWNKPNQREVFSKDSLEEIMEAWRTQEK